ncbi:hypothetical protein BC941DRAFT_409680 [Chlamydoabsidia padenii]|nr:hypothetical protein BC941DRAFT_409680 [Chlamydoabsidia padenii]
MTLFSTLPVEIVTNIFLYLSIQDLARLERTCKCFQQLTLHEIDRRIKTCSLHEDWDILIHLGQVVVTPARFDIRTKKVFYSVPMDPIRIKAMYDHQRQIHCALSFASHSNNNNKRRTYDGLQIIVKEGMKEGITEQVDVQGHDGCELHASLTKLQQDQYQQQQHLVPSSLYQHSEGGQSILSSPSVELLAPLPLIYSIQVDELSLPLSKLICIDAWPMREKTK